jgi:hypothetical protein
MKEPSVAEPENAWQPFTPRGVAMFARAPLRRLLLVQFVVAMVAAGTMGWFAHAAWFPVIGAAIERMPGQGEIRAGWLDWRGDSPQTLAENHFLALTVDLRHEGEARSPAHVQVELGRADFRVLSLLGSLSLAYPRGVVSFNRGALMPWWGAWSPVIVAFIVVGGIAGLLLTWALLATAYFPLAWLAGYFANRDLSPRGSWRLAGAALLPGALLMSGALVLFGLGVLDLVQLLAVVAVHFVVGWFYLVLGPIGAPKHPALAPLQQNPFANAASKKQKEAE